jgi:hypothetical protein
VSNAATVMLPGLPALSNAASSMATRHRAGATVLSDIGQHMRQTCLRIGVIHLAVTIRLYITAARYPPRSEPANSHDLRPNAIPRSTRSA